MITRLLFLILFVAGTIAGVTVYLQSDDIKDCGDKPSSSVGCEAVDAVVAISGGDTAARTNEAIKLFQNGWGKYLIFSGAAEDKTGPSNAYMMKQIAIDSGVSEKFIYIDEKAESTRENAEELQDIFEDLEVKKIILITSGYHQKRSQLEFEEYTDGITIINHPASNDSDWSVWWWLTPRGWWLAGGEIVKIVVFSLVGA